MPIRPSRPTPRSSRVLWSSQDVGRRGNFFNLHQKNEGSNRWQDNLCMHGEKAPNGCEREAINGREDEIFEERPNKIYQLNKNRKWHLSAREAKTATLETTPPPVPPLQCMFGL